MKSRSDRVSTGRRYEGRQDRVRCMLFASSLKQQLWCAPNAGKLIATPLGKSMLSDTKQAALLAVLFHLAFWHTDLGYFARGLLGSWPQVVLALSGRSCTVFGARPRNPRFDFFTHV